jgi:hypothetical protein
MTLYRMFHFKPAGLKAKSRKDFVAFSFGKTVCTIFTEDVGNDFASFIFWENKHTLFTEDVGRRSF